jgi:hypothetical protein
MPFSSFAAANVRHARFRSSSSPQALAELCLATNAVFVEDMIGLNIFSTKLVALQRIESSVCPAPGSFKGANLGERAGGPHADTAGTFTVSMPFLRPQGANWQVACGIYPQMGRFLS